MSAAELREFRNQHDLSPEDDDPGTGEVDLRDEIEAEIEAAAEEAAREREERERKEAEEKARRDEEKARRAAERDESEEEDSEEEDDSDTESDGSEAEGRPRRRRRRGRRGRRRRSELEGTFDHGESDGYGLWLDPAIQDNPVYEENWAGHREVVVTVEEDQIVIRRAGEDARDSEEDE